MRVTLHWKDGSVQEREGRNGMPISNDGLLWFYLLAELLCKHFCAVQRLL
jgi:hypothetical protein